MKSSAYLAPALAALLMLAGCSDNSGADADNPSLANSDKAADLARGKAGEAPAGSPKSAMDIDTPSADGKSAADAALPPAASQAAADPPAAFQQCRSCHSTESGKHGIGPSLAGVVGKPAASVSGFRYSPALQGSGIVWDRARLDEWLAGPTKMVPGTRMVMPVRSEDQRKAVIDYLEALR